MKKYYVAICSVIGIALLFSPINAQSTEDFFDLLQGNLPPTVSATSAEVGQSTPVIGDSEAINFGKSYDRSQMEYQSYDAGRDRLSGYLGAGAVLIAVIAIIFVFALAIFYRHDESKEK